ncbi:SDR family oxidoreductase [Cohnella thailandensis]|uniref:SDR family oxidoreductase n=1 Tax=Cohnella thailandensis TaxID=557557 RepID=A0A841STF6_9BACL|nr:SDR family oxidoreductase [Cohnella thailandensis]MBB6633190.1 SDR family oxidoreductase [Cohnella thailandensis]MBP1975113.1 NADP-dependent 3-hydroxy acid dehydrogenase YdfG [Cohnella thailandensis]
MNSKVAIVTGASSGMGAATAKLLAQHDIKVMLAARREERLQQLQEEIRRAGGEASYKVTDVTSYSDVKSLVDETVKSYGQIDILINNAGIMPLSFFKNLKVDEWERMIDVNIKGVLYGMAAVYRHMEQRNEGHIINFSSIAGHILFPSSSIYSATKHAVRILTEGMRTELGANQNIRTTLISPGAVETELYDTITDNSIYPALEKLGSRDWNQLDPGDIARTVLFAIQQPAHVTINELIVRPTSQSL